MERIQQSKRESSTPIIHLSHLFQIYTILADTLYVNKKNIYIHTGNYLVTDELEDYSQ